jgi:DNA-binding response OmpR family regulator
MNVKEPKKKILIAEDEPHMAFNLQFNLQAEGYDVVPAATGQVAIDKFDREGPFDLIILDVMLPEADGFQVAEHIRKHDDQTHILMLTALGKEEDRLKGFESGVDDYITKPFHLQEFLMRVKRMVKRSQYFTGQEKDEAGAPTSQLLRYGPFELDVDLLQLKTPSGAYTLTAMEADILKEFMRNPKKVLSRDFLLERVWGMRGDIETRTVDNFVARLRKYLEVDPANPQYLVSVRGRGYRLLDKSEE